MTVLSGYFTHSGNDLGYDINDSTDIIDINSDSIDVSVISKRRMPTRNLDAICYRPTGGRRGALYVRPRYIANSVIGRNELRPYVNKMHYQPGHRAGSRSRPYVNRGLVATGIRRRRGHSSTKMQAAAVSQDTQSAIVQESGVTNAIRIAPEVSGGTFT